MQIEALVAQLSKSHVTDATDTAFPSRVPTDVEPSGDGVISLTANGVSCPPSLLLLPIGTGANDMVLTGMRVLAWDFIEGVQGVGTARKKRLWIPSLLAQIAGVFGNVTGVDGTTLAATYFFMDTMTLTTGNANVSNEIISPTGEIISRFRVATGGAQKLEVTFDLGANMTGANCLWSPRS